jgi:hypothetical protein
VGAASGDEESVAEGSEAVAAPFSRAALLEHLQSARARLSETLAQRSALAVDDLCEALARAVALLGDLEKEVADIPRADAQKLEGSLTGIERMLTESLRAATPTELVAEISGEIKKQLRPYRGHMEAAIYEQTLDNFLLKRLREQVGVPRLSLFYL